MHDSDPRKQLLDELQVKSADIDPMIAEGEKEWKPKKKKKRSTKRKVASTRTKKKPTK